MSQTAKRTEIELLHRGESYTLYLKGIKLYLRFSRKGKQFWRSLDTSIKAVALSRAKAILTELEENQWEATPKEIKPSSMATIGEILHRWRSSKALITLTEKSVTNNASALEGLIRKATGKQEIEFLPASILTEKLVTQFISHERDAGRPDHSTRSHLTQARGVLQEAYMEIYHGLSLPDLSGFRSKKKFKPKRDYGFREIPRQSVIDMELAAGRLLEQRSPLWIVYVLMANLGLRNGEVKRTTWSHFAERPHYIDGAVTYRKILFIEANYDDAVPRDLEVPDEIWEGLQHFRPKSCIHASSELTHQGTNQSFRKGEVCQQCAYLIPAKTDTEREIICNRLINDFVRPYIPDREKKSYELRKWAGSKVLTREKNIFLVQQFLGHQSVVTTQKYYAKYLKTQIGVSSADTRAIYGIA